MQMVTIDRKKGRNFLYIAKTNISKKSAKGRLQYFLRMALFIQFDGHKVQQERTSRQNCLAADQLENILLIFKKSLCQGGTQTIGLFKDEKSKGIELTFTAKINNNSELLYRFWIGKSLKIKSRIALFQKSNYLRPRSSQIKKNISKTIAFINSISKKSPVFLIVNPHSAQYEFLHGVYLGCDQLKDRLLNNLKILAGQCLVFAKSFCSLILYKSNIITKYSLLLNSSTQIQSYFTSQNGQLSNLSSIRQNLGLSNCKIQSSIKQAKKARYQRNYHQNLNKMVDVYNNRAIPHELVLFTENSFLRKAKKFKESDDCSDLMFSYKPKTCQNYDNNCIFSTIYIQQSDDGNAKEVCIAETSKTKIIYLPAKIKYGFTTLKNDIYNSPSNQSTSAQSPEESQQASKQNQLAPATSITIEKALVFKTPQHTLSTQNRKKIYDMIKYEKMVLRCLRGAECMYLPKYYQTTQKNSRYKDELIIDYIPGISLGDYLVKNGPTATFSKKLNLLMHIANAIRFLQSYDIAHLDLSVNNIILNAQGIPKIIDFGEAYHQQTLLKLFKQKKGSMKKHLPGRTFPFAPPQTSQRCWDFSSKQDIFSLGIIAFRILMGCFPNSCSQYKLYQLYRNKNYNESIFLCPEGLEYVGQYQIMLSCMQLIINCLNPSQQMRPNPSWTHILFKKMFQLVETTN